MQTDHLLKLIAVLVLVSQGWNAARATAIARAKVADREVEARSGPAPKLKRSTGANGKADAAAPAAKPQIETMRFLDAPNGGAGGM